MDDFWDNVARYPRYLLSLILGIFFFLGQQLKPLFNNPLTATILIFIILGIVAFFYFTIRAMLGLPIF
ncbi:MAG: DUF751 family protein [Geminocystis sp.]|nr:DUF751 family protein [Geminocystis sp.]HIK38377.1 DUF751 family protein [Geminocystis sp. M7585_C2015_104]MCS7147721.1 DUF751 family protein [Geminocystis sp.]MCX8079258.1 DUF751 family protein [Geminocystis sp.]MDW8116704.1 DUF751 family protein [Geminocystis sp.]